jgi:hypothetical protein
MTAIAEDNIFGFYASINADQSDQELVKKYLWGENGLKEQLKALKWQSYGRDFHLILFEFYVKPIPSLRNALKEIGNYRRKEKSIGIPVILEEENFFKSNEPDRQAFFQETIIKRLELLKAKVKRNKLDLDILKLINDTGERLQAK